ncbi:type II toxin-antitoxin system prevent-host-death family antitoxin [Candidatus Fermentibacteria bacterium]|nr:type II toxin-antitoxin system prevent-host-death family antitoxin [Candidatus Fermentibacteria bacterium]
MMTETVDLDEAQARFKDLIHRVRAGVHIVVSVNHKPVARMLPAGARIPGLHAGAIRTTDDFDEPVPESLWSADA